MGKHADSKSSCADTDFTQQEVGEKDPCSERETKRNSQSGIRGQMAFNVFHQPHMTSSSLWNDQKSETWTAG